MVSALPSAPSAPSEPHSAGAAGDAGEQHELDVPQDMSAFGVALADDEVDRDDVAAGNLGALELAADHHGEETSHGVDEEGSELAGDVTIEGASDGAETQASVLLEADASMDLDVTISVSDIDEGLDAGEEGPSGDDSRADVSTTQLADEEADDDEAHWNAFSDDRPIGEKPWIIAAERAFSTASASEARIAVMPTEVVHGAPFEESFEGALEVGPSGISTHGKTWLPFVPTALARLSDEVLVVAAERHGTSHVYAGRIDEAPFLIFALDREDGDTEVRDIVEIEHGILLRGAFGEVELHRP